MTDYKSIHTELCGRTIEENNNIVNKILNSGLDNQAGIWLFGYGSIMWKTNFRYERKCFGYIKDYLRRFWQSSVDHRGTLEKPGRVATLIPATSDEQVTYGVGYYIPPGEAKETLDELFLREKHGFSLSLVDFYPKESIMTQNKALLFIARSDNEGFVKGESLEEIAEKIAVCEGPSGSNREYLFKVVEALLKYDAITADDKNHTLKLYNLVKDILNQRKNNEN